MVIANHKEFQMDSENCRSYLGLGYVSNMSDPQVLAIVLCRTLDHYTVDVKRVTKQADMREAHASAPKQYLIMLEPWRLV
ncbi:hypothetical protein V6N13_121620 [Hibiscus sabdariffa]|uniref:Uncharacterized protein n=1 Tax=Hibiscus sabdariffa TaxID=183260 RepID=A0ABR2PD72_9ROSI